MILSDRRRTALCAATTLLGLLSSSGSSASTWFSDTFRPSPKGAWRTVSGTWEHTDSSMFITATGYDRMTVCSTYVFGARPWSIEASLRGPRAGLVFNLDDPSSKALSQMVRFEDKSLLSGYFTGNGEFVATTSFELKEAATTWTTLRVQIDPLRKRCTIVVNDSVIGADTLLRYPSGWAGLQASDGKAEFRAFTIAGDPNGNILPPLEARKVVPLRHIRRVRMQEGLLQVYDPERNALLTLDDDGRLVRRQPGVMPPPDTVVGVGERRFVIMGSAVLVLSPSGAVIDSIRDRLVAPRALAAGPDSTLFVADPGAQAVFAFTARGELRSFSAASALGGFLAPQGLVLRDSATLVIADYSRLVLLPVTLREPQPVVTVLSPAAVTITWPAGPGGHSAASSGASVLFAADGASWKEQFLPVTGGSPSYVSSLSGLAPLHRYSFKVRPIPGVIPSTAEYSREFRFSTPPADRAEEALTRLPVMCMIYRTISYRDVFPTSRYGWLPWGRTISDDEIDYLRRACTFNSAFYFRNSGCRVMLDFDIHVVDDTLRLRDVGDSDPYWLSVNERVTQDFEHAARDAGRDPSSYNGLIVPYAWVNYPPRRTSALRDPSRGDSITIRQMYGGGTYGVPAPWKYGTTSGYTGNPFQDRFSRQDWLITHEFHHQIDALMEASGFPEYDHADQPWKMPGRFGEDFDFNAAIIRRAGRDWWLCLRFGRLDATRDADHDGLPDDDPSLPFDERRLGANAWETDSDGDGLADLAEIMAGHAIGASPSNPDTDGDGIPDGTDPEPLYPFPPVIPRLKPGRTGPLASVTARTFAHPDALTRFHLAWDDSFLYAGYTTAVSEGDSIGFLFQIDASNDGWFHGFDNTQIRVRWSRDSATVLDYYLRDCSSWSEPPADRKEILRKEDLQVSAVSSEAPGIGRTVALVIRVPGNSRYGPFLHDGARQAIRLGLQTSEDRWVWNELFERNAMMSVSLSGTP